MRKITLHRYCDPGHSWFKVKRSVLTALGIESKITHCSYSRGDYCYLEEDIDAYTLDQALRDLGIEVRVIEHHTNRQSKIRSYYHFAPLAVVRASTMYHEEI